MQGPGTGELIEASNVVASSLPIKGDEKWVAASPRSSQAQPPKAKAPPPGQSIFAASSPGVSTVQASGVSAPERKTEFKDVTPERDEVVNHRHVVLQIGVKAEDLAFEAAKNGKLEALKQLHSKGIPLNMKGEYGSTLLHYAASYGHLETVKYLVDFIYYDTDTKTKYLNTPLECAVEGRHLDVVDFLCKKGARITGAAMCSAVNSGVIENVQFLLDRGGKFSSYDYYGKPPIHSAIYRGDKLMLDFILKSGGDIFATTVSYDTSHDWLETLKTGLHVAAERGQVEMIGFLVEKGLNVNAKTNPDRETPLYQLVKIPYGVSSKEIQIQALQTLVTLKANVNAEDKTGRTALHRAVENGDHFLIPTLLALGADVNSKDKYQRTPLLLAAECYTTPPSSRIAEGNYRNVITLLLEHGANYKARDYREKTPAQHLELTMEDFINTYQESINKGRSHLVEEPSSCPCLVM